jgi:hypothetical protein
LEIVMATYLICAVHRLQYPRGTTCPRCPPKRRAGPARAAQHRARKQALIDAGHQCVAVGDGIRCTATLELEAAHVTRYADTGHYDDVVMLCRPHHLEYDRQQPTR